jgi:hypothetical protein
MFSILGVAYLFYWKLCLWPNPSLSLLSHAFSQSHHLLPHQNPIGAPPYRHHHPWQNQLWPFSHNQAFQLRPCCLWIQPNTFFLLKSESLIFSPFSAEIILNLNSYQLIIQIRSQIVSDKKREYTCKCNRISDEWLSYNHVFQVSNCKRLISCSRFHLRHSILTPPLYENRFTLQFSSESWFLCLSL